MDPMTTWETIIDIIKTLAEDTGDVEFDREELVYTLGDLASWIQRGGFVDWQKLLDYAKN